MFYGEEIVGFIMNIDIIILCLDVIIDVVLCYICLKGELFENMDMFYVVNWIDNFVGIVLVICLFIVDIDDKVFDVMDEEFEVIFVNMLDDEVVSLFEWYNWFLVFVVDENYCLVGWIIIDDVVDIICEDVEYLMMSMVGFDDDEDIFVFVM